MPWGNVMVYRDRRQEMAITSALEQPVVHWSCGCCLERHAGKLKGVMHMVPNVPSLQVMALKASVLGFQASVQWVFNSTMTRHAF